METDPGFRLFCCFVEVMVFKLQLKGPGRRTSGAASLGDSQHFPSVLPVLSCRWARWLAFLCGVTLILRMSLASWVQADVSVLNLFCVQQSPITCLCIWSFLFRNCGLQERIKMAVDLLTYFKNRLPREQFQVHSKVSRKYRNPPYTLPGLTVLPEFKIPTEQGSVTDAGPTWMRPRHPVCREHQDLSSALAILWGAVHFLLLQGA